MRIGVSGASGHLGKGVLAELLRRADGGNIVGISRTPETVARPAVGRRGDYDRPGTLAEAYSGLERLLIIPSPAVQPGLREGHFIRAIDAAVNAGVGHIVLMSSAAAREVDEREMFAAYLTGEQHLMKTAPRWTILRMNYYAESFGQLAGMSLGTGVLPGLGESHVAFVSRDDVAAAAAGVLVDGDHAGAIYNATGPAAVTGAGRVALLSEAAGKSVQFVVLDEVQLRAALAQAGLPEEYIEPLVEIEKRFVAGDFNIVTGDVERLSGRAPRALREVLMTTLRPELNRES